VLSILYRRTQNFCLRTPSVINVAVINCICRFCYTVTTLSIVTIPFSYKKRYTGLYLFAPVFVCIPLMAFVCFVCFHGRPWQATDVLQPAGLLYRPLWTFQLWPPDTPAPTDRVPHSSGGSWNLWAENKDREFCLNADFHGTFRVFYIPQICDMRPTALIPFRRKACCGFF
jgi:hypothetical protein